MTAQENSGMSELRPALSWKDALLVINEKEAEIARLKAELEKITEHSCNQKVIDQALKERDAYRKIAIGYLCPQTAYPTITASPCDCEKDIDSECQRLLRIGGGNQSTANSTDGNLG